MAKCLRLDGRCSSMPGPSPNLRLLNERNVRRCSGRSVEAVGISSCSTTHLQCEFRSTGIDMHTKPASATICGAKSPTGLKVQSRTSSGDWSYERSTSCSAVSCPSASGSLSMQLSLRSSLVSLHTWRLALLYIGVGRWHESIVHCQLLWCCAQPEHPPAQ